MSLTSHSPAIAGRMPRGDAAGHAGSDPLAFAVVDAQTWDRTVSGFDGVCQEQLHVFASRRWPHVDLEPVLFYSAGQPVGGTMMMVQRLPLGIGSIALTKWGPVLADGSGPQAEALMARMIETLAAEYGQRRAMMVSIMPKVEAGEDNRVAAMLAARGFTPGVGVRYPLRYLVDIGLSDADRMAAFGQKWRYNLRKSLRHDMEFEHARPEALDRFMALYQAMSDRKLFPDHSGIDTAGALMDMPEGTARPELFFVNHGGETVAGAMIFTAGDTACYLYGASNDAALGLRAGYYLHWRIIGWLRDNTRARLYDLGGSDGFAGLHQFKTGMVGDAGAIRPLPPMMNFASDWRARAAGTFAYKAREWLTRSRDRAVTLRLNAMRAVRDRAKASQ